MVSRFVSSGLVLLLASFLACADMDRSNPLDPKSPDFQAYRPILVEAFVNTGNPFNYNEIMISALHTLQDRYQDEMLLAIYHRNTADYADGLHLQAAEQLYEGYLTAWGSTQKAVPDVFFNGNQARVQGASSHATALSRCQSALNPLLGQDAHYTLNAAFSQSTEGISCNLQIARLSGGDQSDFKVKLLVTADLETQGHQVVTQCIESALQSGLGSGQQQSLTINGIAGQASQAVICIVSDDETEILHAQPFSINGN